MDFSWESMQAKLQPNAFGEKQGYNKKEVDTRFWTLSKDEDGNGAAIIRFLPDPDNVPFIHMIKINAQKGNKGFFVNEWSPQTIGKPCPFNEKFLELWSAGEKEKAKYMRRSDRFITNIKIIKDPANPENEGKIFLFDMSKTMMGMIKEAMIETEQMKALGEKPIAVFNPLEGNNFLIKSKMGENKIITYDSSKFADSSSSIYDSADEAVKDITGNAYKLSEFLEESFFLSYDELTNLRDRVLGEDSGRKDSGKSNSEDEKTKETEKTESTDSGLNLGGDKTQEADSDLDDLLADLG